MSVVPLQTLCRRICYSFFTFFIAKMEEDNKDKVSGSLFNGDLEFWMTQLPPFLKRLPIIHLAIPGSHNTMTYTIHRFNDVGPDEPAYLRWFGRFCSLISKPIIYNWSVTQYEDIREQLNGGIRYLDLRLATKPDSEGIYFLHGLYGSEVTEPLNNVASWLSSHPLEIVILDCQHFYAFTENHHRNFVNKIKSIFGEKLCPTGNLSQMSLQWFVERKYQIIVIYRNEIARIDNEIWPSGFWPTPWPNTVDPINLLHFLDVRLKSRIAEIGFVSQCLLTPDTGYVIRHLCGSLHRDLATICRNVSLPWIRRQKPGIAGLNIVITDYVSYENFVFSKIVIQRNHELLRVPELAAALPRY